MTRMASRRENLMRDCCWVDIADLLEGLLPSMIDGLPLLRERMPGGDDMIVVYVLRCVGEGEGED